MTQHQKRVSNLDIRVVSAPQPPELVHANACEMERLYVAPAFLVDWDLAESWPNPS